MVLFEAEWHHVGFALISLVMCFVSRAMNVFPLSLAYNGVRGKGSQKSIGMNQQVGRAERPARRANGPQEWLQIKAEPRVVP